MKQYYYANGDQQLGPFSIQELQSKNLRKDTYVWYEGLSDWTRAGDLPELGGLFETPQAQMQTQNPPLHQTPPPPAQTGNYQAPRNQGGYQQQHNAPSGIKPKTWLVESILVTLFCCLVGGIVGIVYASQVDSKWAMGDTAGAQKSSDNAKLWVMISFGVGIAVIILYFLMVLSMGVGAF